MLLIDDDGDDDDDAPPPFRNADPCNKSCEIIPPPVDGGLINLPCADLLVWYVASAWNASSTASTYCARVRLYTRKDLTDSIEF